MQFFSAEDAKYRFGRLIVIAGARSVAVAKHRRRAVTVPAIEEYERPKAPDHSAGFADQRSAGKPGQ